MPYAYLSNRIKEKVMSVVFGNGKYYVVATNGVVLYSAATRAEAVKLLKGGVK